MASDDDHVRLRVVVDGGRIAQASTTRARRRRAGAARRGHHRGGSAVPARSGVPRAGRAGARSPTSITSTPPRRPRRPTREPRSWPTSSAPAPTSSRPATAPPTPTPTCCAPPAGIRYASRSTMAQVDAIHRAAAVDGPPTDGYGQITSKRLGDLDGRRVGDIGRGQGHRAARTRSSSTPAPTRWCSSRRRWPPCCCSRPGSASTARPTPRAPASPTSASSSSTSGSASGTTAPTRARSAGPTTPRARPSAPRPRARRRHRGPGPRPTQRRAWRASSPPGSSIGQESFGGYPGDLFLDGGDESIEQLIAGVERGLLVTDFWYNRILDPKTQVVTGLTRNGLFLIEGGEVTAPVQNLRYTQSVVGALGPRARARPRQRRPAGEQRGRDRPRPQPPPGRLGLHRQRPGLSVEPSVSGGGQVAAPEGRDRDEARPR